MIVLDFLRRFKYSGPQWFITLGSYCAAFTEYVKSKDPDLFNSLYKFISKDPNSESVFFGKFEIDLPHLAATIQGYSTTVLIPDFWVGWGGDLATAMADVTELIKNGKYKDNRLDAARYVIGNKTEFSFGLLDVYSDIDAIKLADLCKGLVFSKALTDYYTNYCTSLNRYNYIVNDIFDNKKYVVDDFEVYWRQIFDRMYGIREAAPGVGLLALKGNNPDLLVITDTCKAFAEYLINNK